MTFSVLEKKATGRPSWLSVAAIQNDTLDRTLRSETFATRNFRGRGFLVFPQKLILHKILKFVNRKSLFPKFSKSLSAKFLLIRNFFCVLIYAGDKCSYTD